jgi:hypothetical protein
MRTKYLTKAASITDKNKKGFSHGPYDRMGDLYSASICACEGHTLITTAAQLAVYQEMKSGCKVSELGAWAALEDVLS